MSTEKKEVEWAGVDDDEFISTSSTDNDDGVTLYGKSRRVSVGLKSKLLHALGSKKFKENKDADPNYASGKHMFHTIMKPIKIPVIVVFIHKIATFWECFMSAAVLVMYLLTTYIAIFSYYHPFSWALSISLELLFLFDTLLRLAIEIWRHLSHCPCEVFITQYTFWQFIFDILANVPINHIYLIIVGTSSFRLLNYLFLIRFNRFIRLIRARQLFRKMKVERRGNDSLLSLVIYIYDYIILTHFFACCAYALNEVFYIDWMLGRATESIDNGGTANWLYLRTNNAMFEDNKTPPKSIDLYLITLHFIVAIFTTVGYGDLYPLHYTDILLTIAIMIVGAVLVQGTLNNLLTEFHVDHDIARFDLFFRFRGILKYMKRIRAPSLYVDRVTEYYKALWNYREGTKDVDLSDIPVTMQQELMYDICEEMLFMSPLFRDLEQSFLFAIARIVKIDLYIPGMIVAREGDYSQDMHYVIQGELRVRGKYDPDHCAMILRPGSIIGDVNLLFSFPALTTIETRTTCQILTIRKHDFMAFMKIYPQEMSILRQRLRDRFNSLLVNYKLMGHKSVSWVQKKEIGEVGFDPNPLNFPIKLKRTHFFNRVVKEDIKDDSIGTHIVSMKPFYREKKKEHFACYQNCNIEGIFSANEFWVMGWHIFIILFASIFGLAVPYCKAFDDQSTKTDSLYCQIFSYYHYISYLVHFLDILVDIYVATPSKGLFYRLRDGLKVSVGKAYFWIDVLAVLPYGIMVNNLTGGRGRGSVFRSFFKCAKVFRLLCHLDNVFPMRLFLVRMCKALVLIVYFVHIIACLLFVLSCPTGYRSQCKKDTWFSSMYRTKEANDKAEISQKLKEDVLRSMSPYIYSVWFATATVTSAGFGDFTPQQQSELIACIIFQLTGVFFVAYIIGGLASALTCGIRPRLTFQQKLSSIRIFLQHHSMSSRIQERIIEHYVLQDRLLEGVVIPEGSRHLLYDAPTFIAEDTLFWEVEIFLEGVPIFTKCDSVIMTRLAKLMKRYLLPPNLTFVDRGEVRRAMYVICKGSVGMFTTEGIETAILEATGHFGIRDLLFGEPHEFFIKTKSYVILYTIDFQNFVDSFEGYDEDMMGLLYEEKTRIKDRIHDLVFVRGINTHLYDKSKEKPDKIKSFVLLPWKKGSGFPHCTFEEYRQIYKNIPVLSWLYRICLMPVTFHPAGVFAKVWNSIITIISLLNFTYCFVELLMQARHPLIRCLQLVLDSFGWMNMYAPIFVYVKLHWCYFNDEKLLVSHPAKTAYNYMFNGFFVYDVLFVTPFELFLYFRSAVNLFGYGMGANWFTKLRMNRCLQIYRVPELFSIVHNVFKRRTLLLVMFYLICLFWVTSVLGCIAVYLSCPWFAREWKQGDELRMLACEKHTWIFNSCLQIDRSSLLDRWIISIYYVLQAVLTVGFGDTTTLEVNDLLFLIPVTMFGFIFMQVVIADIIAAEVDTNENRALFLEERRCLLSCLKKEKAPKIILTAIDYHLDFAWEESRGCNPKELFVDLHPSLASDVFEEFVGDTLTSVPLFRNFSTQVLRSMSKLLKKQYFLKGSRLTRFGNLEYEMFIVVEGRVYMTGADNDYMATLGKNQFFGEISMLYGQPRMYSAIAATEVGVFVLDADDFAELIEKYPSVKEEILRALKRDRREIWYKTFVKKRRKDPEKWKRKAKALNIDISRMIQSKETDIVTFNENTGEKKMKFKCRKWFVGYGPENDKLPFLYFAVPSYSKRTFKFLIHPKCMFWRIMSKLGLVIYYVSVMATLYLAFFANPVKHLWEHDTFTTVVFEFTRYSEIFVALFIVLKFFVPFEISYNNYCKEWCKIAFRYVSDPTQFLVDIVGAIPWDFILPLFPSRYEYDEFLAFIRFVRLIRVYGALRENRNSLRVNALAYKLTISLSVFTLCSHTLACILYFAAAPNGVIKEPSWVFIVDDSFRDIEEDDQVLLRLPSVWYLRSFYFMITILTSCGFGENIPRSFLEYVLVCVTMLFGAVGLAIVLATVSAGLAAIQKAKREYFYKISTHVDHLKSLGLSKDREMLLLSYYINLWKVGRGHPYHKAVSILPLTMQFDCCAILFREAIMKCDFFGETTDETFIRNLAVRMIHSLYLAGNIIVNQGEPGNSVYIVYKGTVSAYVTSEVGSIPEFSHKINRYESFGQSSCLFKHMMHGKTYRAETNVEILQIDQNDVQHISKHYPLWRQYLERLVRTRYANTNKVRKHIFAEVTLDLPEEEV